MELYAKNRLAKHVWKSALQCGEFKGNESLLKTLQDRLVTGVRVSRIRSKCQGMNEKINANVCENVQFKQQVKQQLIHWIEISNIWHTIENSDKKLINSCTDVYI